MVEPARRSALDGLPQRIAPPDLVITERPGLSLVHIAAKRASSALGVALPIAPNTTAGNGEITIFWVAPGHWLIQSERLAANEIADRLRAAADTAHIAIANLSGGRTVLRICGGSARHVLAQGCPIDLHPREFPPDSVAHSVLEDVSVMLHHLPDASGFDLYVPRSYGQTIWEWLREAAGADPRDGSA